MNSNILYRSDQTIELTYDVVVVGGGPAGITAALESARSGAKTALIERYGVIGGNLTTGFVGPLLGDVSEGTIVEEIESKLRINRGLCYDFEFAKYIFVKLLTDAGVDIYYQTFIFDAQVENGQIKSAKATGKCGNMEFYSKIYIDASGDGDLAYYAGCPFKMGRESDGLVQPVSLLFIIEGIDLTQDLVCFHEEHHTMLSNGKDYLQMCKEANFGGELPPTVNIIRLYRTVYPGERMVNAAQANGIHPFYPADLQKAEYDLREQSECIVHFLRKHIDGFGNIRIKNGSYTLGVRESRRILGDYVLQDSDLLCGRKFDDVAVHNANFAIDIHNPSGSGQAERDGCPNEAKPYDIPFSCMRPIGLDNLYTAGRCISGTHRAHASYRVMRICMAMGQAVGAAGSIAAAQGKTTRNIEYAEVQQYLTKKGIHLFN